MISRSEFKGQGQITAGCLVKPFIRDAAYLYIVEGFQMIRHVSGHCLNGFQSHAVTGQDQVATAVGIL